MRKVTAVLLCTVLVLGLSLSVRGQEETVTVTNPQELLELAENCRLDSYSQGLTVHLGADIDLTGVDFQGIPIFCGTFQGNGYTVSGFTLEHAGSNQGFFRYLSQKAVVEQLHISGDICPTGSRENAGGIAGSNAGVIRGCSFSGMVSAGSNAGGIAGVNQVSGLIENCTVTGDVSAQHFAGGIAGSNYGVLSGCENQADVNTTPLENSVDIQDVTLQTITDTESVGTVTDVGGVAGTSTGTIRRCVNRGNVGYRQMSYNIGGIAGSQTGYTVDCENYGAVFGRKDVGGITGHLEPVLLLDFQTDTLQQLRSQLGTLAALTDRASANVQSNSNQIKGLLTAMENYTAQARTAVEGLADAPLNPDAYIAAYQTLSSSLTAMESTARQLAQAVERTASDLETDLEAVTEQMNVIRATVEGGEENLGGSLMDGSDADAPEDLTSKIENCRNLGQVQADWNAGGIAGAVALENDLDPEEDVLISGSQSLNLSGTVRSVVQGCSNAEKITAGKRNAGGIVGWQSMGLVRQCGSTGAVQGGSYTGGVAGQSFGYIRQCYSKCVISGSDCVGGIAGSGAVVTDCRSMADVSGTEKLGAVLGALEQSDSEDVLSNYYTCVRQDPGGIDGIGYSGRAQKLPLEEFLALEELPELFGTVNITFVFHDGTEQILRLVTGEPLTADSIPAVPSVDGCEGIWEGLPADGLEQVLQDMTFTAAYGSRQSTIASQQEIHGKPQLLVQGDFAPGTALEITGVEAIPELQGTLLQAWQLTLTQPGTVSEGRYLMENDWEADRLAVYVRTDGSWQQVSHWENGSYLVFDMSGDAFAVVRTEGASFLWIWIGAAAVVLAAAVTTAVILKKKKR